MAAYALAELTPPPGKPLMSLSQNESLRPPSPAAIRASGAAMSGAVGGGAHLYPDPEWSELRAALSQVHSVPAEAILCGNGSMELIASLMRAYGDPQNAVLAPAHAYPFFRTAAQLVNARFDVAPETDGRVSVAALAEGVEQDTRIVCVANPGNPTGTRLTRGELLQLRAALPEDVLLVIDEAYGEFADHLSEPMFDLVAAGNTVVLRTLSKAYGLAGLRVGWGVFAPEIAREMRKVMNPNNISLVGQAAATAALRDQPYMRDTCQMTAGLRDGFIARLRQAGFDVPESFTNFALIRFATPQAAARAERALRAEGVFLRAQAGAGLPHCLRATIDTAGKLDLAARILERWAEEENT